MPNSFPDKKKIPILNVLGQTDEEESPGIVEFTYRGGAVSLAAHLRRQDIVLPIQRPDE